MKTRPVNEALIGISNAPINSVNDILQRFIPASEPIGLLMMGVVFISLSVALRRLPALLGRKSAVNVPGGRQ
jgi:hypothetical protein